MAIIAEHSGADNGDTFAHCAVRPDLHFPKSTSDPLAGRGAMTQKAIASYFGLSTRTIRRWDKRGVLRGKRVEGVKLYPVDQVSKLMGLEA